MLFTVGRSKRRALMRSLTSLLWRRFSHRQTQQPIHWPITVAAAAPATPILGIPNMPKIRMGSRMMLITAPVSWLAIW